MDILTSKVSARRQFDDLFNKPATRDIVLSVTSPKPRRKTKLKFVPNPPERPLAHLAGRDYILEPFDSAEDIIKREQISPAVVKEVRDIEARRAASDRDFEEDFSNVQARFQEYSNDPALNGASPMHDLSNGRSRRTQKGAGHGVDANGDLLDVHETVFNGLSRGTGMSVIVPVVDCAAHGPRRRSPWWLLNENVFENFLRSLIDSDPECILKGKELAEAAGLDRLILVEFYIRRKEDREIYFDHVEEFKREEGRKRHTSSGSAVQTRRRRLVEDGNRQFGQGVRPAEGSEHHEHLAMWAPIKNGPSMHPAKENKS